VAYALSIGTKIIDLGWPWTAKMHSGAEKMCLLEPTAQIWMKIDRLDPYYQRQKCRPITLVSDGGCWRRQFLVIWVATSFETSEIKPAVLYEDMQPPWSASNWLQNDWPRITLSVYFLSKYVFLQHFLTQSIWLSKITAWKVTNLHLCYQWQKCRLM